ncbi:MAG: YlxR family protein [Deltaproteobacteria bacterium]|nr:YlxR family protein [Deltaproteobacteria bacterium]MCW5808476.1 YlxR family protein [Deltaproteobacteria bacterium]
MTQRDHIPLRTCTGCRAIAPQRELVRIAVQGPRLVADPARRLPGRGAYVHARPACVTVAGLARSLRRTVVKRDLEGLVSVLTDMSRDDDNSSTVRDGEAGDDLGKNAPGLAGAKPVETPPRRDRAKPTQRG